MHSDDKNKNEDGATEAVRYNPGFETREMTKSNMQPLAKSITYLRTLRRRSTCRQCRYGW